MRESEAAKKERKELLEINKRTWIVLAVFGLLVVASTMGNVSEEEEV